MRCLFVVLLLASVLALGAGTYYSRGNLPIDETSSWRSNRDGSGSSPSGFLLTAHDFIVQDGDSMDAEGTWTLHYNSTVLIETGGKITSGSYNHDIFLSLQAGATYEVTHFTYGSLEIGTLDPASTFIFNKNAGLSIYDDITFGNVTVRAGSVGVAGTNGLTLNGNLKVETGAIFSGGTNSSLTNSIGSIEIDGGTFYGSSGSAGINYNIAGDVVINSGTFYSTYLTGTEDLPANLYYIGGSFENNGTYYARNRAAGGYPSYYFSGCYEALKFANSGTESQCNHYIRLESNAHYTLAGDLYMYDYRTFSVQGYLDAGTCSVRSSSTNDASISISGHVKTAHPGGLFGYGYGTFCILHASSLAMGPESTIEYWTNGSQTFSPHGQYKNVALLGGGVVTLTGEATISTSLLVDSSLAIHGTLNVNGSLNGICGISGSGTLVIGGNGEALYLLTTDINNLTVNRSAGCNLAGNLTVSNLTITLGNLCVGANTLTLNQNLNCYSGTLVTDPASTLVINDNNSGIYLPALSVGTFLLNRASYQTNLNGNLTVYTALVLQSGSLNISTHTLTLYGSFSRVNGSIYAHNGTVAIGPGDTDINWYSSNINSMNLNRPGKRLNLTTYLHINNLNVVAGVFDFSEQNLGINTLALSSSDQFIGNSNSELSVDASGMVVLPPLDIYRLDVSGYGCQVSDYTSVQDLYLYGTLDLGEGASLTVEQTLSGGYGGQLNGANGSNLYYNGSNAQPTTVPRILAGNVFFNRDGTTNIYGLWQIRNSLHLIQGTLNIPADTYLNFFANAAIYRSNGYLDNSGFVVCDGTIDIIYETGLTTGDEIPADTAVLNDLSIPADQVITADRDIHLNGSLNLGQGSTLELEDHTLYLSDSAAVICGADAWIFGRAEQNIGATGFHVPALGLVIEPGPEVSGFAVTHAAASQTLPCGSSINRSWQLEGTFSGSQDLTLIWASSADNALDFSTAEALVLVQPEALWTPVCPTADVSLLDPRQLSVTTEHFSDWTVSTADLLTISVQGLSINQNHDTGQTELTWTHIFGVDHFKVYRSSCPEGPFDTLAGTSETTSFAEAQYGDRVFYRVRAEY